MDNLIVVSVVRDYSLYSKLVTDNAFFASAKFADFDNRVDNRYISVRYNSFLDNYDYSHEAWFVFCHEDWELLSPIADKLERADKDSLYGPIGTVFIPARNTYLLRSLGYVKNSDKNGRNIRFYGRSCSLFTQVDTFDCQCLAVHSSLVQKHHLRFDEQLQFDLYVEDFCINAFENYGIKSKILGIKCQHYSYGNIQRRFYENFDYLTEKWQNARYSYSNCLITRELGKKLDMPVKRESSGLWRSLKRRWHNFLMH